MRTTPFNFTLNATVAALLCIASGSLWAGVEGTTSTFYGVGAGGAGTSSYSTFVGRDAGFNASGGLSNVSLGYYAGRANASGNYNIFLGSFAGTSNTSSSNTMIGISAGYNNFTGQNNVFLGAQAGRLETGSYKLYIDSANTSVPGTPLIYGEFDNHLLKINGEVGVSANGVAKSQLHFSQSGTDVGGWLTSVADNNFFMSSGAKYDAAAGGWIQKSSDGKAVMAGSGASGYRVYTNQGAVVGASIAPTSRLHIDYSGNLGLNTLAVAGQPITTGTGAVLSAGGAWMNASSRELKENIKGLSAADAQRTLALLSPVSYNYKVDRQEKHVGFIAEDVPDLVASKNRKSLSALDIVAVLTKVAQEQKNTLEEQKNTLEEQKKTIEEKSRDAKAEVTLLKQMLEEQRKTAQTEVALLKEQLSQITAEVRRLKTPDLTASR